MKIYDEKPYVRRVRIINKLIERGHKDLAVKLILRKPKRKQEGYK